MGKLPMFYNAMMLTGVNLLLRFVSTGFQVFVSGRIGPAGVGLLQLVLSVWGLAMTAGIGGVRTASMYLNAEELGRGKPKNVAWILTGCFLYSLVFSLTVGSLVYGFSPWIAEKWIGDMRALGAVRLCAVFLPITCLNSVMVGYFTAANRIATLAVVEVAEQLVSMAVTAALLLFWAENIPGRACQAVVAGGGCASCVSLCSLIFLRVRERAGAGERIPVARRLVDTALPLALADDLKAGISTTENLMVPKRLALYTDQALAQFGMVCGMVFPVLMFPAAILYGLSDILIPELARCNAAGSLGRIRYLSKRSLKVAVVYGCFCGGILYLLSGDLCQRLYGSAEAGNYLRWFSLLAPMLYCDAVVDAMTKGLGQQKTCVRNNIITSVMDVVLLFVLLPSYGLVGYFASFLISHLVNILLSLGLLLKLTQLRLPLKVPMALAVSMAFALWGAEGFGTAWGKVLFFCAAFGALLAIFGVLGRQDAQWLRGLVLPRKNIAKSEENL